MFEYIDSKDCGSGAAMACETEAWQLSKSDAPFVHHKLPALQAEADRRGLSIGEVVPITTEQAIFAVYSNFLSPASSDTMQ